MGDQTYELGDRVTFTRTLHRRSRYDDKERHTVKRWEPSAYDGEPEPAPQDGIIIGSRTLQNGHNEYLGYEEGIQWHGAHYFRAYLIAFAMHRAPVYVLPEHVQPAGPAPEPVRDPLEDHPRLFDDQGEA